jgi:hypothetical protein
VVLLISIGLGNMENYNPTTILITFDSWLSAMKKISIAALAIALTGVDQP